MLLTSASLQVAGLSSIYLEALKIPLKGRREEK